MNQSLVRANLPDEIRTLFHRLRLPAHFGCPAAPAENYAGTEYEPEIIPTPVIMHLIKMDAIGEQGDNERKRANEPMPESPQKAGGGAEVIGDPFVGIAACKTGGHQYRNEYDDDRKNNVSFHISACMVKGTYEFIKTRRIAGLFLC